MADDASKPKPEPQSRTVLPARPQALKPEPSEVVADVLARFPKLMARLAE